jgi:hypothetical protein
MGWLDLTSHRDWLHNGYPCSFAQWKNLDWSKARIDMGPSPAGNLGPYWHVPERDGDCTHRLYPRVLQGKWADVIRRAIEEITERTARRLTATERRGHNGP